MVKCNGHKALTSSTPGRLLARIAFKKDPASDRGLRTQSLPNRADHVTGAGSAKPGTSDVGVLSQSYSSGGAMIADAD
jgi:hypothetical protein